MGRNDEVVLPNPMYVNRFPTNEKRKNLDDENYYIEKADNLVERARNLKRLKNDKMYIQPDELEDLIRAMEIMGIEYKDRKLNSLQVGGKSYRHEVAHEGFKFVTSTTWLIIPHSMKPKS